MVSTQCALILYTRQHFINHLLTYLLTHKLDPIISTGRKQCNDNLAVAISRDGAMLMSTTACCAVNSPAFSVAASPPDSLSKIRKNLLKVKIWYSSV